MYQKDCLRQYKIFPTSFEESFSTIRGSGSRNIRDTLFRDTLYGPITVVVESTELRRTIFPIDLLSKRILAELAIADSVLVAKTTLKEVKAVA